jgi:hypothetical protein
LRRDVVLLIRRIRRICRYGQARTARRLTSARLRIASLRASNISLSKSRSPRRPTPGGLVSLAVRIVWPPSPTAGTLSPRHADGSTGDFRRHSATFVDWADRAASSAG